MFTLEQFETLKTLTDSMCKFIEFDDVEIELRLLPFGSSRRLPSIRIHVFFDQQLFCYELCFTWEHLESLINFNAFMESELRSANAALVSQVEMQLKDTYNRGIDYE